MIYIQLLSNRLFYGTLRQRLVAPTSEGSRALSTHESENVFSILPVSVSDEGYDLYDGLSSYFHSTAQLYSNTVSMEITLVDLPPVLQIQLQVCGPGCDYYLSSQHVSA
jgi:ubiquitin carboxyl-terminal hydrolase 25/28